MAAGNIFWEIHDKIWDLLEAKQAFTDVVPAGNRIKFTGNVRQPQKEMASAADFPEVMVRPTGTQTQDRRASNGTYLKVQWEVLVHSGQQPFDPFFDVQWAVWVALLNWDATMRAIEWNGEHPVSNCDILTTADSLWDDQRNHNIRGWGSVWVGKTDCWFGHVDLQAVL